MTAPETKPTSHITDLERTLTWWLCFTVRLLLQMVIRNAVLPRQWLGTGLLANLVYSSIATVPVVYLSRWLTGEKNFKAPRGLLLYALPPILTVLAFGDCAGDRCWHGLLGAPNAY